jgi:hypothetical protein
VSADILQESRGRAARSARDVHTVQVTGSNPVSATNRRLYACRYAKAFSRQTDVPGMAIAATLRSDMS